MKRARIAIVGSGAAGVACASALRAAGLSVSMFDKGRAPGGRLARRTPQEAPVGVAIDHGAPVAHDGGRAKARDTLARVADRDEAFGEGAYRAKGGATALTRALIEDAARDGPPLRIHQAVEIAALARGPEDLALRDASGGLHGPFDAVAVTIPAAQAADLIGGAAPPRETAAMYAPVSTCLLAFEGDADAEPEAFELRPCGEAGPIERAIRFSGAGWIGWALHADAAFTEAHLDAPKPEIAKKLRAAFEEWRGAPARTLYEAGHRWRYARVSRPVGRAYWLDDNATLGLAGDWRLGPTVGDAIESGRALGDALAAAWTAS